MHKLILKITLLFFINFLWSNTYGQDTSNLDSLLFSFKKEINDTLKANTANSIANSYYSSSNYKKSIEYNLKSFQLFEKINNDSGKANAYSQIGVSYYRMLNWIKSAEYFKEALRIAEESNNREDQGRFLNNLGNVYEKEGKYSVALEYHLKALDIKQEIGDSISISKSLSNIGNMYYHNLEYPKAINYYKKSLAIKEKTNDVAGLTNVLQNIGFTYYRLKDYKNAIEYVNKGHEIASKENNTYYIISAYSKLSDIYFEKQNYKEAHHFLSLQNKLKDSLDQINNAKLIAEMDAKFETEKKDNEIAVQKLEIEKQNAEVKLLSTQKILFSIGLLLSLILFFVAYRGYNQKKKSNIALEEKNKEIEEKNKEITDSITYAKRIQEAILPSSSVLNKFLKDGFVLYKPKDIVAGDFYWMHTVDDVVLFAVADCTGHGVPGAMVSVVCHHSLTRAVRECNLTDPGLILDKTREFVIDTFANNNEFSVSDGMDIALCAINYKESTLKFAGANNPLYVITTNNDTIQSLPNEIKKEEEYGTILHEIKGDKQPIGDFANTLKPFTTHAIKINKKDIIYLFTDGFADQFGGEKGKKLKYKEFKKLLLLNSRDEMNNQQKSLNKFFQEWKDDMDQVDDVCVVGIKI